MNIGLIADDSKKNLMLNFCIAYRGILNKNQLFATGTTGELVEKSANLAVHKFLSGDLGGEQQLCSQIEQNQFDLIIFLKDSTSFGGFASSTSDTICNLCDAYNIPLATNLATAELLIKSLGRGDMEWREIYQ